MYYFALAGDIAALINKVSHLVDEKEKEEEAKYLIAWLKVRYGIEGQKPFTEQKIAIVFDVLISLLEKTEELLSKGKVDDALYSIMCSLQRGMQDLGVEFELTTAAPTE